MTDSNRVIWSEGLFLRPQHFQQQQRHLERYIEARAGATRRHHWGVLELEIDRDLLRIGKFALRRARGVFPDGTPFLMPDDDPLPPPLELDIQGRDRVAYLALPVRRSGAPEIDRGPGRETQARYSIDEYQARDITADSSELATLEVGALRAQLLLDGSPLEEFATIPVARIIECRADRQVVLDDAFIATTLDVAACPPLARFAVELAGMLAQRAEELSRQVGSTQHGGVSDVGQFLLLSVFNRHEPVLKHLARQYPVHPEEFYQLLLTLTGDLATLSSGTRRPPALPEYVHERLQPTFEPLVHALRGYLDVRPLHSVVPIALELRDRNAYLAVVRDTSLFDSATFIIAAKAQMPGESLRRQFPSITKLAPASLLRRYVEQQVPGIPLRPISKHLPMLPYLAGYEYFEIERTHESWPTLKTDGAFGLFVGGGLPGLDMQMWAFRQ